MAEHAPGRPTPEWLGRLAHDLRNPITPMRSAVQLLQLGQLPPELAPDLLRTLDRQVDFLLRLIDDVADLVKIEQGTFALRPSTCDIGQVVESAVARHARGAGKGARGGSAVDVFPADAALWVDADEGRLCQLVEQILGLLGDGGEEAKPASIHLEREGDVARVRFAAGGRPLDGDSRLRFLVDGDAPADPSALALAHLVARRIAELHEARLGFDPGGLSLSLRMPLAADVP